MEDSVVETVLDVLRAFTPVGTMIDADTPLMEWNLIDSASMVSILLTLEQRLKLRIDASDLTFDHFHSARVLAQRLASKNGI